MASAEVTILLYLASSSGCHLAIGDNFHGYNAYKDTAQLLGLYTNQVNSGIHSLLAKGHVREMNLGVHRRTIWATSTGLLRAEKVIAYNKRVAKQQIPIAVS